MWLYAMYDSSSSTKPFYSNLVQVSHSGNEYTPSLCEGNCDVRNLRLSPNRHIPREQSLAADNESLSVEIVESTDRKAIWGQVLDRETRQTVYFAMIQLIPLVSISPTKKLSTEKERALIQVPRSRQTSLFSFFPPINNWIGRFYPKPGPVSNGIVQLANNNPEMVVGGADPVYGFREPSTPKPTSGISQVGEANSGGFTGGGNNPNRGRNQNEQQDSLGRVGSDVGQSIETPQQAKEISPKAINILANIIGPTGFLALALGALMGANAQASPSPNADESNSADNRQRQPSPEPSPGQTDRKLNNSRPQPVPPPPPLKPGECLCRWSLNTNRAITRNGVPMVETYDYVTGCNRSAEEVREILRRQGIGTSLPVGTTVNGKVVGDISRVTNPGDISGNGCSDKPSPSPAPQPSPNPQQTVQQQVKNCRVGPVQDPKWQQLLRDAGECIVPGAVITLEGPVDGTTTCGFCGTIIGNIPPQAGSCNRIINPHPAVAFLGLNRPFPPCPPNWDSGW